MGIIEEIKELADQIDGLSINDRNKIVENLDYNEWGIAFEHIVGTILLNKIFISKDVFNSIKKLSVQMDFEKETWERLMPFVKLK